MPDRETPLAKLGFLTIGSFDGADPGPGHERTLRVIELGEGFDDAGRLGPALGWRPTAAR